MNNDQLSCAEKLAFDTQSAAKAEATATQWRHGTKLKTYKCKQCQLWHLASSYSSN
jgi:hypothetical protein